MHVVCVKNILVTLTTVGKKLLTKTTFGDDVLLHSENTFLRRVRGEEGRARGGWGYSRDSGEAPMAPTKHKLHVRMERA